MSDSKVVIAGGGLAAAKTAEGLRAQGHTGPITIVGGEQELPYERPPLSKGYLAGTAERASMTVHDQAWYDDNDVTLHLGTKVTEINRAAKQVRLDSDLLLDYDTLVLATGSRPRPLDLPGAHAPNVLYLREVGDAEAIGAALEQARRLVLIGAGWIGLEVAANARERGVEVSALEMAPLPLLRAMGPQMGQMFADLHREHGVDFLFGARLKKIEVTDGQATAVVLEDGTTLPADVILVGVGVLPNIELAQAAGLETDNGILVDEYLRTSDPSIFAVGDIAAHAHPVLGRLRVEHWANALNQPAAVAATITGTPTPYVRQPYFYTDQYDLGMEYRGFAPSPQEATVVIRGDLAQRKMLVFWLSERNVVQAGMNVNIWDAGDDIAALIGTTVDPARLAHEDTPLDQAGV